MEKYSVENKFAEMVQWNQKHGFYKSEKDLNNEQKLQENADIRNNRRNK